MPRWTQVPERCNCSIFLLPSRFPPNAGSRWPGETLDPWFWGINTPFYSPGAGWSLPREGISPCWHVRRRARFLLFFR